MFIDSHAHFDLCLKNKGATEESLIEALKKHDIKYAVQVSIDTNGINWAYELSRHHERVLFTIGIHPSSKAGNDDLLYVSNFVNKVIESNDSDLLFGIGETGLDYYRMHQPREKQIISFEYQIEIAKKWDLPVIVHSRDAMDETLKILKEKLPGAGIMHCFSGNKEEAAKVLDLGFHISFAGNLTYKNAYKIQETASFVPLDRLLLETDAPFLTPAPFRGKKNRPEYVIHTYEFLANLRKEKLFKLKDCIHSNFVTLNKS